MYKPINKINIFLIIFLSIQFPKNMNAQANSNLALSPVFMMSSVGNLINTSNQSPAIQFKSMANCIDVQNGLIIINGERANGQFAINCEVDIKFNSLGIKLYPNPAVNRTKLQVGNTPTPTEIFSICIWSPEGQLISTRKETGYSLMQGLNIDVSALSYGTYILRVESPKSMDALKFIKAN
jgi:hypothetical protein